MRSRPGRRRVRRLDLEYKSFTSGGGGRRPIILKGDFDFSCMMIREGHVNLVPPTDNHSSARSVSASVPAHGEKSRATEHAAALNVPLISVCMPVYNAERYVAEAIESILS